MKENQRLVATFSLLSPEPRSWSLEDLRFFRDIAARARHAIQRRKAEADLRMLTSTLHRQVELRTAERNLLAMLVERTDILVMVCGVNFDILALNNAHASAFLRLYGLRPVVGDNLLGLIADPISREQVRAAWSRGLAGEQFTFVEEFGIEGGVRAFFEVKFETLRDERGTIIGCYQFVTDVSAGLRERKKLADAQEALRQSQKMEAVGQLTGGLAHDLLVRTMGPEISFEVVPGPGLCNSLIDAGQLESALLNLCINARDAMPHGGSLTIETGNVRFDEPAAREIDVSPGEYVSISVCDTGTGMSPDRV